MSEAIETANLGRAAALRPGDDAGVPRRAPPVQSPPALQTQRVDVGGISWTVREDGAALLHAMPADCWAAPDAQGWTCVKRHARREVWRIDVRGRAYYLKYYFGEPWYRRWRHRLRRPPAQAEWEGGLYALQCGVAAPRPVAWTSMLRRGRHPCALLVTEAITSAVPLNEFWLALRTDPNVRRRRRDAQQLCEQLAELIARAHQSGLEHLDMHAANILVQTVGPRQYRTTFVDLQSIRRGVALSVGAVVRNLAQLNQWFRRHSSAGDRLRFLRAYLRWRDAFETRCPYGRPLDLGFAQLVDALKRAAYRHAQRLWAQRDRRLLRNGHYFVPIRTEDGWRGMAVRATKHPNPASRASELTFTRDWWRRTLTNPLRRLADDTGATCKDSHSATVRRALLEHEHAVLPVIVKRPLARNWRRRLAQWLWRSRSRRSWCMGHALLHRDLPTARPLAMLERRLGPIVLDSVSVVEAIPGAVDLERLLTQRAGALSARAWWALKRELCRVLAAELRNLHDRGFEHRDCKAGNILVTEVPVLRVFWIDMDGLRHVRRRAPRVLRALARLHVSLCDVPGLTRSDRVRFLKMYFAGYGVDGRAWRTAWPALAESATRKRLAKEARRRWKLKHYGRA